MQWRDVLGWEGLYEVSDKGDVRSIPRMRKIHHGGMRTYGGKILVGGFSSGGYHLINMKDQHRKQTESVHRLVLQAFIGPCPAGLQACHNNGDPSDNRVSNLRWDTKASNTDDIRKHGRLRFGAKNHATKLSDAQVAEIRQSLMGHIEAGAHFGVTPECISQIRRGVARKAFGVEHGIRFADDPEQGEP